MVPEKRAAIMTRARQYGDNRVVAGIHYPSDIEMGRIAGSVISQQLSQQQDFQQQYRQARDELRRAGFACGKIDPAATPGPDGPVYGCLSNR